MMRFALRTLVIAGVILVIVLAVVWISRGG